MTAHVLGKELSDAPKQHRNRDWNPDFDPDLGYDASQSTWLVRFTNCQHVLVSVYLSGTGPTGIGVRLGTNYESRASE